jgi:hypothetical protein
MHKSIDAFFITAVHCRLPYDLIKRCMVLTVFEPAYGMGETPVI